MFHLKLDNFVHFFLLSLLLSDEVLSQDESQNTTDVSLTFADPIRYYVNYGEFWEVGASWSGTGVKKDYSHAYPVMTYNGSLDEFIEAYPSVTIESYGYAVSNGTIGNVGQKAFGGNIFPTELFKSKEYVEKCIVNVDQTAFWWHTSVQIGYQFKSEGNTFYLRPFIDGWIYSAGPIWRVLQFGLGVTTITFNPKDAFEKNIISWYNLN
ncbi:hypothetical protein Bhyg_04207 [Pseudolycoriella hygida]|uniref:Uncharacterized protein n=1 Tax=Pseudolycoriella hygida TaxID=35572 RepID=A0A9Q0NEY1_9DIPT|nr:hypothetical protein Bhyg_04207 [Pseudolycoriella hygida]